MAKRPTDMYESRNGEKFGIEGNVIKIPTGPKGKSRPKDIHEGHRERLRQRFLKEGLENFEDHNILELLLFYSIPIKDTNAEAHALINTFGSLSEVFDASFEDLCEVQGIGPRTAALIKLMPELFREYEKDKLNTEEVYLNTSELAAQYASKFFKGLTEERLYLLCLDSRCRLIKVELVSEGTMNSTPISNRAIIEKAYKSKASSVILVHNHPTGITAPSTADINVTTNLVDVLSRSGVKLSDHIIIGHGDDFFSFRKSSKWKSFFK